MADDGFQEIQLDKKQLVFLFLAATVLVVLVFIIGVWVGRGVRKPDAEVASEVPVADQPMAANAPPSQPTQVSPGELDYAKLLEAEGRPVENKPAAKTEEPPTPADAPGDPEANAKSGAPVVPPAKAEPAKPDPAPAKTAERTKKEASPLMLQVGAFADRRTAEGLVSSLKKKGYPAVVVTAANTPTPYKVRVGPYTDRAEADRVSARLKKEEGFSPLVTR